MRKNAFSISNIIEKTDLGSWSLLLPGLFILAICLLLPAWVERQQDLETRNATQAELNYAQRHLEKHEELSAAWQEKDPILIQRLAWHQLRMQREDLRTVNGATPHRQGYTRHWREWVKPDENIKVNYEIPERPAESKLTRLVFNPRQRIHLIALGAFMVFLSLVISMRSHFTDHEPRHRKSLRHIFIKDEQNNTMDTENETKASADDVSNAEHLIEEFTDENVDFSDLTHGDSTMFDPRTSINHTDDKTTP